MLICVVVRYVHQKIDWYLSNYIEMIPLEVIKYNSLDIQYIHIIIYHITFLYFLSSILFTKKKYK
jgi:hypothetical protein